MTDLQVRLEQLKIRIDQNSIELDSVNGNRTKLFEEKSEIEKQIADSEVTYSIGDRFRRKADNCKFILVSIADYKADLIRLETGARFTCPIEYSEYGKISSDTMTTILLSFTRYYDARKQEKC